MSTYVNGSGSFSIKVTEVVLHEQDSPLAGGGDPLVLRKATLHVSSAFGGGGVESVGYAAADEDAIAAALTVWDNKRLEGARDA